jgi:hypothetical protein
LSAAAASRASSAWPDEIAPRAFAGQRLDAAHAGGDRAFGQNREKPDIAQPAHMRAAAQFDRERLSRRVVAHGEHAHFVAIFLAEQRFGARRDRLVGRHQPRRDIGVLAHDGVDLGFDALEFFRRHGLGMAEIEAQPVRRDQRALLRDMRPSTRLSAACSRCVAE